MSKDEKSQVQVLGIKPEALAVFLAKLEKAGLIKINRSRLKLK